MKRPPYCISVFEPFLRLQSPVLFIIHYYYYYYYYTGREINRPNQYDCVTARAADGEGIEYRADVGDRN